MTSLRQGETEAGVQALHRALDLGPNDAVLSIALGRAFVAIRHLGEAELAYRRACQADPTSAEGHKLLARLLMSQSRDEEAAQVLLALTRHRPDAEAHSLCATALEREGDLEGAIRELDAHLKLEPQSQASLRALGLLLQRVDRAEEAGAVFRRVLALDPSDHQANTGLAVTLSKAGLHQEAIETFRRVLTSTEGNRAEAHANLGMALHAAGRLSEAITQLLQALECDPRSAQANCDLAIVLHDSGDLEAAIVAFRKATRLAPDWATPHYNLGLALSAVNEPAEAEAALARAAELAPDDVEISAALRAVRAHRAHTPADEPLGALPREDDAAQSAITGDLGRIDLRDLIEFLRHQRISGTLRINQGPHDAQLFFRDGDLAGALCSTQPSLREQLVDDGLLPEAYLSAAIDDDGSVAQSPEIFAHYLLQMGLVDREPLTKLLERHILEVLRQVLRWSEGHFSLQRDDTAPFDGPSLAFDPRFVLIEASRLDDEASIAPAPSPIPQEDPRL